MDLGALANIAQIVSVLPLVGGAVMIYRHRTCTVPRCVRLARHKVPDTAWEVCTRHHTAPEHERLAARYRERHPDGLTHAEAA